MRTIVAAMLLASAAASSACADEPVSAKTILDEALTSAQLIEASAERASMLLAIGKAQIAAGDPGAAKATLDQALAATKTIGDYLDQATSLAAVVDAELQLGDRTIAAAAAAAIDEPVARAASLTAVATAQAAAGDSDAAAASFGQALDTAGSLDQDAQRAAMLAIIAAAQARAGDKGGAAATLARAFAALPSLMQPQDLLSIAIAKIAWAQATSGDRVAAVETFRKAWQSAQSIAHTSSRRIALMGLAEMEADAGDHAGAARTLQEVRTLVAAIADNGERDRALIDMAAMQAGVKLFVTFPNIGGLFEGESTAFPAALAATPRSLGSDGLAAPAARPQGDPEAALDTALAIADPLMRFQALKLVAAPALAAGDRVALLPPLRAAQAALVESQKAGVQPGTSDLYDFLLMCVLAGEMDRPLAAAKRMAEDGWPPYLLANIAWVQAQMGDKAAANSTLQDLLTSSLARLDPRARDGMRAYLAALVEANIGDMAAAQASANRIPRVRERTALLVAIATQQPPPEYDKWMLMNFSE